MKLLLYLVYMQTKSVMIVSIANQHANRNLSLRRTLYGLHTNLKQLFCIQNLNNRL